MKLGITVVIASLLTTSVMGASHLEEAVSSGRNKPYLPDYTTLTQNFTKAGKWAADDQKTTTRKVADGMVSVKFSKKDAEWMASITEFARAYRWKMEKECFATDPSSKSFAKVMDYCFTETAVAPAVSAYIAEGKEEAKWIKFNSGDMASCRDSVGKYFKWKKEAIQGRDLLASDIEFQSKMDRFYELALGETQVTPKWSVSTAKETMTAVQSELKGLSKWKDACHFTNEDFAAAVGDGSGAGAGGDGSTGGDCGGYGKPCGAKGGYGKGQDIQPAPAVPVNVTPYGATGAYGGGGYGGGGYQNKGFDYGALGGLYNKQNYQQPQIPYAPPPPAAAPGAAAAPPPPPPPFIPPPPFGGVGVGVAVSKRNYPRPRPYPPMMPMPLMPPMMGGGGGPMVIAPYAPEPTPIVRVTVNDYTAAKPSFSPMPMPMPWMQNRPMPYPNLGIGMGRPMPLPYPRLGLVTTPTYNSGYPIVSNPVPIPTNPSATQFPIPIPNPGGTSIPIPTVVPQVTTVPVPPNRIQIPRV